MTDLQFDRPEHLVATKPPEERGRERDDVRLLVSTQSDEHIHARFGQIADFLTPKDLLVVNQSATLPAALDATGPPGEFLVDLCTDYGNDLWLVEPRWNPSDPGPLPLSKGDEITVGDLSGHVVGEFPSIERLVFVRFDGDIRAVLDEYGRPIQYGYVEGSFPLDAYQTYFAAEPGSAEMPSAARPFTERVLTRLRARGIGLASITLHTGVSSLEVEYDQCKLHCSSASCNPLYPESFRVPSATVHAVNRTHGQGGRVIAVGTSVVRALETAWNRTDNRVEATGGFTRLFVTPDSGATVVDGLLTGMHDPETTHLSMLYAIADRDLVMRGYEVAIDEGYLWHEFGDSHLILP